MKPIENTKSRHQVGDVRLGRIILEINVCPYRDTCKATESHVVCEHMQIKVSPLFVDEPYGWLCAFYGVHQ